MLVSPFVTRKFIKVFIYNLIAKGIVIVEGVNWYRLLVRTKGNFPSSGLSRRALIHFIYVRKRSKIEENTQTLRAIAVWKVITLHHFPSPASTSVICFSRVRGARQIVTNCERRRRFIGDLSASVYESAK